jgi:Avidin family.
VKLLMSALVLGLLAAASGAQAQGLAEQSLWKNTKGSLLLITKVDEAGKSFRGTFVNYAKGYSCEGVPIAVSGSLDGDRVSMVGSFAPCAQTMTIWQGTVSDSTLNITFDLRYVDKAYKFQETKGSDVFTRQN